MGKMPVTGAAVVTVVGTSVIYRIIIWLTNIGVLNTHFMMGFWSVFEKAIKSKSI